MRWYVPDMYLLQFVDWICTNQILTTTTDETSLLLLSLTFEQLLLWILGHFIKLTFLHCVEYIVLCAIALLCVDFLKNGFSLWPIQALEKHICHTAKCYNADASTHRPYSALITTYKSMHFEFDELINCLQWIFNTPM